MDLKEAVKRRHSVRQYKPISIDEETVKALNAEIDTINNESGLHIQLILNEPKAFNIPLARYGSFSGVNNYFAIIGKRSADLQEKCGYYGERLVLRAQQLGLHTCWVGLNYKKIPEAVSVEKGEKLTLVIAVGHGKNRGVVRKSKTAAQVSNITEDSPAWFKEGVECALLAPTAVNQQKFYFTLNGNKVSAKAGIGFYSKMDLGIAKYHFEVGAGTENFSWE